MQDIEELVNVITLILEYQNTSEDDSKWKQRKEKIYLSDM